MEQKEITLTDYVINKLSTEIKELKVQLAQAEFSAMLYKEKYENLLKSQQENEEQETESEQLFFQLRGRNGKEGKQ